MANIDLLTAVKVKSIKAPGDYLDGRGLYLQVRSETSKSWLLKYSMDKRAREMGLGSAFDFTLAEAREERDALRKLIKRRVDPLQQRKADRQTKKLEAVKAITFRVASARYIADNGSSWKNAKHAAQWGSTLETYAHPVIGDLPLQSIDTALIIKVLRPIWSTKSETAGRLRGRIETIINSCKAAGKNPARWKGNLEAGLPDLSEVQTVEHHPALPYAQLPAFMMDLRKREGIAAVALEFQILTVSRPGNLVGARWSEFNLDAAVWTIAAENMKGRKSKKNKKPHKVQLCGAALAVLKRMAQDRNGEFVFHSPGSESPLSDAATGAVIDRMNESNQKAGRPRWIDEVSNEEIVPHGFRSTFRDWAAERGYPDAVADAALAHKVSDAVVAAYKRTTFTELRKKMLEDWAVFATSDPADVLPFTAAARAES